MEWPLDAGQGCRPWALLDQDDRAEDAAEGTAGGGEEGVRVASSYRYSLANEEFQMTEAACRASPCLWPPAVE